MALGRIPGGTQELVFDGKDYLVLYTPLKDASGKSVGTIVGIQGISHDQESLDNVVRFDIGIGTISFLVFLALAIRYSSRQEKERRAKQATEFEQLARLKSFFSPQLAEAILASGGEDLLKAHRREITVVFSDLRGFTQFTETVEPEDVMEVLRAYHQAMGAIINTHGGTLEHFAGDGIMIFFNDPMPTEFPAENASRMALAMQDAFVPVAAEWQRRGIDLGLGIGIATGYATLGAIGFEGRWGYAANGNVANLAARLCSEAKAGEILMDRRTLAALHAVARTEDVGELMLKGFAKPVPVQRLLGLEGAPARSAHAA
jgi:class 3 adenylate cyclase